MELFLGKYEYALDSKNRVRIPLNFIEKLGNDIVVTLMDNSEIILTSSDSFSNHLTKMISSQGENKLKQRDLIRWLSSNSVELKIDGQSRIVLSNSMLNHISAEKNVVILGYGNCIAITSIEKYKENSKKISDSKTIKEGIEIFEDFFM